MSQTKAQLIEGLNVNTSAPADSLVIDSSGNVGLGTSSPSYQLDLDGGTTVNTRIRIARGSDDTNAMQIGYNAINLYRNVPLASAQNNLTINQVGSDGTRNVLGINSSGNVGIGTTSPSNPLNVYHATINNVALFESGDANCEIAIADNTGRVAIGNVGDDLRFLTSSSGTERARIDSSGRLLVGTSSSPTVGSAAQYARTVAQGNTFSTTGAGILSIQNGSAPASTGSDIGFIAFGANDGSEFAWIRCVLDGTAGSGDYPGALVFSTTADGSSSPTERMRINNDGRMRFNSSSDSPHSANVSGAVINNAGILLIGADADPAAIFNRFSSNGEVVRFNRQGADVGSIDVTTSATSYNTSSDYRLKENVVPLTGAADRVNQLQVYRFNFIADPDTTVDGFIAHEAQAVVPEAVTGTHDEVNADGNPVYQGIDQSKLVPLLAAALQEALAEIESLKARVTALEP